jgi:hypothetical protein
MNWPFDYYAITEPDIVATGKRLFRWLDGTGQWLARELAAIAGGPVALLIQSAGRLAHLAWEVLPVFERLGDVHPRAVVQGKIADVLAGRG